MTDEHERRPAGRGGARVRMTGKERREQLLTIARKLFADRGFEATSIDDDRVQALLAAEVLVDDRLGDLSTGGDLLHRGTVEAALSEKATRDLDQLLAALGAGHPGAGPPMVGGSRVGRIGGWRGHAAAAAWFFTFLTSLPSIRSLTGHRTSSIQPSFSIAQITRAEVSS